MFPFAARFRTIDPLVYEYAAASGATDLIPLDNLFKYVIAQGLWSNFRIYPQKSAQNAGSGSTVYGAGGLTSNNGTLIGSPTWGAGGITFDTSTQLMRIADFLGSTTLTVWVRRNGSATNGTALIAQYDIGANQRSFFVGETGAAVDSIGLRRSADGTLANDESYRSAANEWLSTDITIIAQWIDGGARFCWRNNTSVAVPFLNVGTNQTTRHNSTADITQNAFLNNNSPLSFMGGEYTALAFLEGSTTPTTTQRETITDLINAL
jgi:hypothetical protein